MFSGIVEEMGLIHQVTRRGQAIRMTIHAEKVVEGLSEGESIAVNGACLTALDIQAAGFAVDISPETGRVTNLGALKTGEAVNLERAMRLSDRLNGHLVSGHVDGVGLICEKRDEENAMILSVEAPVEILRHTVQKGSITIDGVSMTINDLTEGTLTVSIIPHTARVTTLGEMRVGASVNLESDLIGKYVEKLLRGD